jgi:serine/threonine protein kinase/tetratricopeptide (TPR) repeat protein
MATSGSDQHEIRLETTGTEPSAAPSSGETTPGPASRAAPGSAPPAWQPARGPEPLRNALTPGTLVGGRFILIQEIGRGSTGTVFEMRHNELGHRVAIKALHPHIVDNPNVMWRFKREAQLTASLKHPNIVSVFDVSQQFDSIYFIVQEFLEGVSFRRLLQQQGRLEVAGALDYLVPIMGALVAAHHGGIVHRDVKPENIFLAQSESGAIVPKLIDFGLAKIACEQGELETQMGAVLGTPSYMSPEQALGERVDARADVWSMGVVWFEALSGERPFFSDGLASTMERVKSGDPKRLSSLSPRLPTELADLVHRALERDLSRRFLSMFDFLAAVLRFAEKTDPSFSSRHAASIPRPLVTDSASCPGDEAEPLSIRGRRAPSLSQIRAVRAPDVFRSELDDAGARPPRSRTDVLAEQALEMNALGRATDLAEQAIAEQPSSTRIKGRMRLVQSIACRWLGKLSLAERYAQIAYRQLPKGSPRWFAALDNLVVVLASLGQGEFLGELAGDLMEAQANPSRAALGAQVRALGQASISLLGAGQAEVAHRAFAVAQTLARALPYDESDVRVWLDLAEAEFALEAGDHVAFLGLENLAMESFAARGDSRNACLQRAVTGAAYLHLGAYARAERELGGALALAEPMQLGFLVPARAHLGFALARQGRLREATATSSAALGSCLSQGYGRFVPVCHTYHAEILRAGGQLPDAESHAAQAVATSASLPAVHAAALGTLAKILLQSGRAAAALPHATAALSILEASRGNAECEALVRLVHVRALAAAGQLPRARQSLELARRRLELRASLIGDPRLRRSFLEEIPEHRETAALTLSGAATAP